MPELKSVNGYVSNLVCKTILMCSVNFWHQQDLKGGLVTWLLNLASTFDFIVMQMLKGYLPKGLLVDYNYNFRSFAGSALIQRTLP